MLSLPLPLAAAHNGGAAALVALLVVINFRLRSAPQAVPARLSPALSATTQTRRTLTSHRLRQYYELTKPRVVYLIVFCAVIGMFLPCRRAVGVPLGRAGRGHRRHLRWSPAPRSRSTAWSSRSSTPSCCARARVRCRAANSRRTQTLLFSGVVGGSGLFMLYEWVNPLTMWLTLATFVGYAVVYTVLLKPNTPQNIVIGGASGAMPPVLGWTAVTGDVSADALAARS